MGRRNVIICAGLCDGLKVRVGVEPSVMLLSNPGNHRTGRVLSEDCASDWEVTGLHFYVSQSRFRQFASRYGPISLALILRPSARRMDERLASGHTLEMSHLRG